MPDYGSMVADKAIRSIDRKLRISYGTAEKELRKKLKDFNQRFKEKDAAKKKQLAEGKISKQDYKNWLSGQVFIRGQWESKVKECQNVMLHHNEQAAKIVNERKLDVFAENYNYEAFLGEKQLGISFGIYNTHAVARMMQEEPQTLPEWKIDEEKDYEWNYKKVNNIVQQGIIQGEGIPEITDRLCKDLSTMNENKMRMFARTAITGAQNAGRQRQMEDAADMGIEVNKRWIATLDSRTRHWHRERDGEEVPYNEDFSGGLEYPGDPSGDPADVFNCRCTMVTIYPKYEDRSRNDVRRAYVEYEDDDGEMHRSSYLTTDLEAYQMWKEEKHGTDSDQHFTTEYDSTEYPEVEISPDVSRRVDETIEGFLSRFPAMEGYFKNVIYTKENGIASATTNGAGIHLDKGMFSSINSLKEQLKKAIESGHTVNAEDPMFIVAHELGHCLENMIVYKRLNLRANSVIGGIQWKSIQAEREKLEIDYFTHMGFKNETTREIYGIIKNEMGSRALSSGSERAAQAVAQVMFGTKSAPHAQALAEYLKKLSEE